MGSQYRTNIHFFTGKVKDSWVFKIIAEGISKSFGIAIAIKLKQVINTTELILWQAIHQKFSIGKFYAKAYPIFVLSISTSIIRNRTKISAFMSQIIKQYQIIKTGKFHIITSAIKFILRPGSIVKFRTRLVADPIVGQYIKIAQIDPQTLVDIDTNTLGQIEVVVL